MGLSYKFNGEIVAFYLVLKAELSIKLGRYFVCDRKKPTLSRKSVGFSVLR